MGFSVFSGSNTELRSETIIADATAVIAAALSTMRFLPQNHSTVSALGVVSEHSLKVCRG